MEKYTPSAFQATPTFPYSNHEIRQIEQKWASPKNILAKLLHRRVLGSQVILRFLVF